jgi:ribonucleoside-triphosphate reductase
MTYTKKSPHHKDIELVDEYISEADWRVKENANMVYSLQGLNNHIVSKVSANYWLHKVYPEHIRKAHQSSDIHIHDLQLIAPYCCGWDLYDLLIKGFGGVKHKLNCTPAKHFSSTLGQLVNFLFTMQMEANGAQAVSNFDTLLAPFVYYDGLTYEEVKQHMQTFVYSMNVSTRVGFQTPFTNITLDLTVPSYYKDQPVIIGGVPMDSTYKEFTAEMDMINRAFAEVMLEGDGDGRIFSFPIPTYNVTKDFDWTDKRLDPIWEMTAKYGTPYFANYVNSDMNPDDARSMCCRLRLDNRELRKRGGSLFGANPLTGSIGVVTLNLPRIGYLSASQHEIFSRIDALVELARESLELKRHMIKMFTEQGLYPYSRVYLEGIKTKTGSYWANHFNTIGIVGMNELLINFLGKDITTQEGQTLAIRIMDHINSLLTTIQQETGQMYNLEATPAEGTSYRFAKNDKKSYPAIIVANEERYRHTNAAPYYTNSTHLPVGATDDIFDALDLQDQLQTKYTGGTVLHGFIGERVIDIAATKKLVKTISDTYKLPYFTITPTFSICPDHGYLSGEHHTCEQCGQKCEVYSRVTGYYSSVEMWNDGKTQEFSDRKEYNLSNQHQPTQSTRV